MVAVRLVSLDRKGIFKRRPVIRDLTYAEDEFDREYLGHVRRDAGASPEGNVVATLTCVDRLEVACLQGRPMGVFGRDWGCAKPIGVGVMDMPNVWLSLARDVLHAGGEAQRSIRLDDFYTAEFNLGDAELSRRESIPQPEPSGLCSCLAICR